jgi:glycosyltransferase involved in cell wall biosynthesis
VAVGRLSPEKRFDLLIRSVAELRRTGQSVSLRIAGEGDARRELEREIRQQGCGDSIRLLGHVADPRSLFEAADIFALSSVREGLPNVLLEAMALETPIVATAIAGIPKVITDQRDGLLVPPGDQSAMTDALRRLIDRDDLRKRLATAGRQTIETRFSFAVRMEKIVAVYDEVLGRRAHVAGRST